MLQTLESDTREVGASTDIVRQGEPYRYAVILCQGWAIRAKTLRDGSRQILDIVLPGDVVGLASPLFTTADCAVTTVASATIATVSTDQLMALYRTHPRLGVALCWQFALEEAVVAEHLVNVGRRDAYTRLGHLLLELYWRLDAVGLVRNQTYDLPLNQAALADALGLSQVHVNRTLRRLRDDGYVRITGSRVGLRRRQAFEQAVDFEQAYLHLISMPVWLRRYLARVQEDSDAQAAPGA